MFCLGSCISYCLRQTDVIRWNATLTILHRATYWVLAAVGRGSCSLLSKTSQCQCFIDDLIQFHAPHNTAINDNAHTLFRVIVDKEHSSKEIVHVCQCYLLCGCQGLAVKCIILDFQFSSYGQSWCQCNLWLFWLRNFALMSYYYRIWTSVNIVLSLSSNVLLFSHLFMPSHYIIFNLHRTLSFSLRNIQCSLPSAL